VKLKPTRVIVGALGLTVGVFGVIALREATFSTHQHVDPDSRVEIVLDAKTRHREFRQTEPEMVEALVLACRLEVSSDVVGPIKAEGNGRYRIVLQPALDDTNRKQLRGCLEDWTLDSLRADVVSIDPVS
jgi:hypothetical protein